MCTVIVEVPERPEDPTRILAIRDEHPERPWDPPGRWWPDTHPSVRGVRDRLAGGAWLAADDGSSLSVILNRGESVAAQLPEGSPALHSRGGIVLASIEGEELPERPYTESFNLVAVKGSETTVTSWNGTELERTLLTPGMHMVAHGHVDSMDTARIAMWLPKFRELAGLDDVQWRDAWIAMLTEAATLPPEDDRSILRDNTPHGIPTKSLIVCMAAVGAHGVELASATLSEPSVYAGEPFVAAI